MTARECLAACLLAAITGGIFGWSARVLTADHRYVRALAERHEAESNYYIQQAGEIITEAKIKIKEGKHGKKTH
jgi:hypothetical protein